MTDKKIIFFALILSVVIVGGGWYYNSHQRATEESPTPSPTVSEPGAVLGNPDAPVVIEEYTNLLCSACAYFQTNAFHQINEAYIKTGKVKLVVYVLPPYETSQAALCALEQKKFFDYTDYAFTHQAEISEEQDLKDFAVNAGLNEQKFNDCYASENIQERAQKWNEEGKARGVTATPIFFINGQKFIGAQPFAEFQKIIEEKLSETK
ncbi:MAG: DsbA family protein [Candidatus Portnoybacteria bacterium]|nr:DsbA family protein [Candidatus Portnoybacteria bacterium]